MIIEENHHDIMQNGNFLDLTKVDESNVNARLHVIIMDIVQAIVKILSKSSFNK